jgi:hypothetical protein
MGLENNESPLEHLHVGGNSIVEGSEAVDRGIISPLPFDAGMVQVELLQLASFQDARGAQGVQD